MATLYSLSIKNFRGVKEFHQYFYCKKIVCLIGRGDSGKTTVLEAISYVLSPSWNITFYDSDFYNCKTDDSIEIEATLTDLPDFFLQGKYGLQIRGIKEDDNSLIDDFEIGESKPALTIRLEVKRDLEPVWSIINERNEPISISGSARAKLNTFLISDYTDRHFSCSKGNHLYSIFL